MLSQRKPHMMPNTLTDDERAQGFRLLFDGSTTTGWRGYNKPEIYPQWRAVDGELRFHPDPVPEYGHDIISAEQFGRFELRIEWKLGPGGNSGIMYHVQETDRAPYMTGPEIQVLDNIGHSDARNGPDRHAGACYALYAPSRDVTSPIGEWNRVVLIVDGDRVSHWLNDVEIVTYTLGSDDWNARIKGSKFEQWPNFARVRCGHICLQDHKDPVAYRNIRIREW